MGLLTSLPVDGGSDLLETLLFAGGAPPPPLTACDPLRHRQTGSLPALCAAALGVATYLGSLWLSHVLSPRLKAYGKLPLAERREWDARCVLSRHSDKPLPKRSGGLCMERLPCAQQASAAPRRFPSTFHAAVIVAASLYLFCWHDVFRHSVRGRWRPQRDCVASAVLPARR